MFYSTNSTFSLFPLAFYWAPLWILTLVAKWKIFQKAGREGWEVLIPIYSTFIWLKIVGKPWYWFFLYWIPLFDMIWIIWTQNMLSKSFGKDEGFTVGLLFLGFIFYPILGFGKAKYQGPYGNAQAYHEYQESLRPSFDFEPTAPQQ